MTANNTPGAFNLNAVNSYPQGQFDITAQGTNSINLTAGTYLVRFSATIINTSQTVPEIYLYTTSTIQPSRRYGVANGTAQVYGDYLLTMEQAGQVMIMNTTLNGISYSNIYVLIQKI